MARLVDKINPVSTQSAKPEGQFLFSRRIQVLLIGVVAISALENSAKRTEILEAQRQNERIAKTTPPLRKAKLKTTAIQTLSKQNHKPKILSQLRNSSLFPTLQKP
jgi:hypothetical protein